MLKHKQGVFTIYHQPQTKPAAITFNHHLFSKGVGGLRGCADMLMC